MLFRTRTLALTGLLLALFAAAPAPAAPQDGSELTQQDGRRRRRQRRVRRRPPVPQQAREFLKSLKIAPEQRELVRDEALRAAPLVRDARQRARELIQAARADGVPKSEVREQLRALRVETLDALTPAGRRLVASLTTEQRARIAAAAAERGRTFDAERLAGRLGRLLAHPRVQERVQRRGER